MDVARLIFLQTEEVGLMWPFIGGIATATVVISIAEIKYKYPLGEKLLDLFRGAEKRVQAAQAFAAKAAGRVDKIKSAISGK
jgi:hypothetical protein